MRTCLYLQLKFFHVKLKIECLVEPKYIRNGSCMGCEVISAFSNGNNISECWDMGSLLEL